MFNTDRTAITYYAGAVLISLAFCLSLITTLSWPMMAELPLAGSIFIQLLAVARKAYSYMEEQQEESLQEVYSRLKGGVFDVRSSEASGISEN